MQTRHRLLVILSLCAIAGVSGVAVAALLFRAKPTATSRNPEAEVTVLQPTGELPVLFPSPEFSLVNQDGKPVSAESLRGKLWIADFVFTRCGGPCPVMTGKLASLQSRIPGGEVTFVTFSVDPENDRPDVLQSYAGQFKADTSRWHFLTTADGTALPIYEVAAGMKLTALAATEDQPIIHSEKFLLIDGNGNVRGVYSSMDPESLDGLVADARRLSQEAGK